MQRKIASVLTITLLLYLFLPLQKLEAAETAVSYIATENQTDYMANYISEIEAKLSTFDREAAYDIALTAYDSWTDRTPSIDKLKILNYLVELEYYYWIPDAHTQHTIEMYDLAKEEAYDDYLFKAIYNLSLIKYMDYDNQGSYDLLQDMVTYGYEDDSQVTLINYHLGMSMLHSDVSEFDKALNSIQEALLLIDETNASDLLGVPRAFELYDYQAYYYFLQDDYIQAIESLETSLELIDPDDYETLFSVKYMLADYHIYNDDYIEADKLFRNLRQLYSFTGPLFKAYYTEENLSSLEANIAYFSGDFEHAADLYADLYMQKPDMEEMDTALTAKENLVNFEESLFEDKLTVYQQLDASQEANIRILTRAIIIISILGAIAVIALLALLWQRRRLHLLSITDHLTKLNNRHKIMDTFDRIKPGEYCIALLDLDHFKEINDTYGHIYGDVVLEKVARTIKNSLRPEDYVGRYGGEEFMIMINTKDTDIAKDITERVLRNIIDLEWDYPELHTTASIGLVYSATIIGDKLLHAADEQMYLSKSKGRNQYNFKIVT